MSSSFSDAPEPRESFEPAESLTSSEPAQEIIASSPNDVPAEESATATQIGQDSEALLPPEARGEANGGPLGCCLGVVVGLLLTALLSTTLSLAVANGGVLSFATIPVLLIGTLLGGFLGWRIGKRIYKEYELSPRQKRKLAQQQRRLDEMERKRKVSGTRKGTPL